MARVAIKVALAALGDATNEELAEIAAHISQGDRAGREALLAMFGSGANTWATENVADAVAALLKATDEPSRLRHREARLYAIAVAGTLGNDAGKRIQKALRKVFDMAVGQDLPDWAYFVSGLSLAKVDADHRPQTLRRFLAQGEAADPGMPGALVRGMCAGIRDEAFIQDVKSFLADGNADVAMGAAAILQAIGPTAGSASPDLLQLMELTDHEEVRVAAAEALGMVASPAEMSRLEKFLRTRQLSPRLREAIESSVNAVQLKG